MNLTKQDNWAVPQRTQENRLLRVIFDADLRCSHLGLKKIGKRLGVDVETIQAGEFVAFINSRKNSMKLYAPGNTIAYFKHPDGRQINLKILSVIPKFFNGKELKYDDALRDVVLKGLREK